MELSAQQNEDAEFELSLNSPLELDLTSNNSVDLNLSDTPNSLNFNNDDYVVAVMGVTSVNGMDGDVTLDIPTKTSELENDSGFITNTVDDLVNYPKTSDLSEVAFTGEFSDLLHIPHGKLTIKRNNYILGSFTDNVSTDTTLDINVPTKTSDLINDTGYVEDANYVHTDNNFTTGLKSKLEGLADIQTIGDNLTLTNGRLDAVGGDEAQVYRGEVEPTDENILIWIDTYQSPLVGIQFITQDDKDFITSDDNIFTTS